MSAPCHITEWELTGWFAGLDSKWTIVYAHRFLCGEPHPAQDSINLSDNFL